MKKTQGFRLVALIGVVLGLLAVVAGAQQKGKKEYAFRGKVEKVDASAKSLTVNHGAIEGWMGAMTMAYKVDKADEVLKKVKAGDEITAKVYDGDYMLYNVLVVAPTGDKSAPRK